MPKPTVQSPSRRAFLRQGGMALAGVMATGFLPLGGLRMVHAATTAMTETFEVTHTSAEWRNILTPAQFAVLREHNTERPNSSPLVNEHRPGTFICAGCKLPLYDSSAKYESGTGWPSFTHPLKNAVRTMPDNSWFATRTEVHCRRCGGHLGHVFDDGPAPLHTRYCMNGVAMLFEPRKA